jgi:hypothetical protein
MESKQRSNPSAKTTPESLKKFSAIGGNQHQLLQSVLMD